MKFENLGLHQKLLRAIQEQGYHTPTPIQLQAIPHVLTGRDLLGCAQTGTGKTAAFALPTLHRLLMADTVIIDEPTTVRSNPAAATSASAIPASAIPASVTGPAPSHEQASHRPSISAHGSSRVKPSARPMSRRKIRALVLAPTRELAGQIGESFDTYGRFSGLRQTVIYGGVGQGRQVDALKLGVDTLIATPGRLLDLMQQRYISLADVSMLILDEADQMLDMGFLPDLRRIVTQVPRNRQTLMFSATMPGEIRRLADQWLQKPVSVEVAPVATPAELVEQSVFMVEPRDKPQLLAQYLQSQATGRTLVFTRTKHGADKVVRILERSGIRAAAIHGNKSQNARLRVLAEFKSQRPPVLVATDIAARGLDIDEISHVINFDVPNVPETYVHRIGRTGRAGSTGIAVSMCGGEEREYLRQIERLMRRRIQVLSYDLPPADPRQDDSRSQSSHSQQRPQQQRSQQQRRPQQQRSGANNQARGQERANGASEGNDAARQGHQPAAHPAGHRQRSFGRGSKGRRYSSRV
ncbi:MAG: DEAD/DEAH box helicase [Pirellulales bacterium]